MIRKGVVRRIVMGVAAIALSPLLAGCPHGDPSPACWTKPDVPMSGCSGPKPTTATATAPASPAPKAKPKTKVKGHKTSAGAIVATKGSSCDEYKTGTIAYTVSNEKLVCTKVGPDVLPQYLWLAA